jgi:hypothetical protein
MLMDTAEHLARDRGIARLAITAPAEVSRLHVACTRSTDDTALYQATARGDSHGRN